MKNSKDLLLWTVVWLVSIRFWIEVVTTTLLKNSSIINGLNNNKVGYHHYQLGLLIVLISFIASKFLPKLRLKISFALGFGLALFFDQYIYVLSIVGINLPFGYRSQTDYVVIILAMIGLIVYWKYLKSIVSIKTVNTKNK